MKCCGINSPSDWNGILGNNLLPGSCCEKQMGDPCSIDSALKEGCKTKFIDYLKSNIVTVAGVGIGVALIQVCVYLFILLNDMTFLYKIQF